VYYVLCNILCLNIFVVVLFVWCTSDSFAYLQCAPYLEKLLRTCGDVVTLRGMPYAEDMSAGIDAALERVAGVSLRDAHK
jgi:hypothetical protein